MKIAVCYALLYAACEEKSLNCYVYCEGTGPSSTTACVWSALASEAHSVSCGPSYTACMRISITQNGESLFLGSCGYENASDAILHLGMNVTLVEDLSHWPSKVLETERQSLRILQLFSRSTRFAHIRTVANSNFVPSSVRAIWQMPDDFLNVTLFNLQSFA